MSRFQTALLNFHAVLLLLISVALLFLFLASGHSFNFEDSSQMRMFFQIILFAVVAIALFLKKRNYWFGKIPLFVLLILVQLSLIDFYIQASENEYENTTSILGLGLLGLFFVSNLFVIYSLMKSRESS